jgi:hypothetical protein
MESLPPGFEVPLRAAPPLAFCLHWFAPFRWCSPCRQFIVVPSLDFGPCGFLAWSLCFIAKWFAWLIPSTGSARAWPWLPGPLPQGSSPCHGIPAAGVRGPPACGSAFGFLPSLVCSLSVVFSLPSVHRRSVPGFWPCGFLAWPGWFHRLVKVVVMVGRGLWSRLGDQRNLKTTAGPNAPPYQVLAYICRYRSFSGSWPLVCGKSLGNFVQGRVARRALLVSAAPACLQGSIRLWKAEPSLPGTIANPPGRCSFANRVGRKRAMVPRGKVDF